MIAMLVVGSVVLVMISVVMGSLEVVSVVLVGSVEVLLIAKTITLCKDT